ITDCDLKIPTSSGVSFSMKSRGNRAGFRLTAGTSTRVLTPYSVARSASRMTLQPRTAAIVCSMRRTLTSAVRAIGRTSRGLSSRGIDLAEPRPALFVQTARRSTCATRPACARSTSPARWARSTSFRSRASGSAHADPPLAPDELLHALAVADFRGVDVAARVGGDVVEEHELAGVVPDAAEAADLVERSPIVDVDAAVAGVGEEQQILLR